jgi:DNA mismatch endonuclease, patch repair protein
MDNLSRAQRSLCMSRVRNADTNLELMLRRALHRRGLRYVLHRRDLAGTPDIVFIAAKIAVFVNGDFWHGFGYSRWGNKLSPFWRKKIEINKRRDSRNTRRLRRSGWRVITVWQHQLKRDLDACAAKIIKCVDDHRKRAR